MKAALAIACLAVASCGRPRPPARPIDMPRSVPVADALPGVHGLGPSIGLEGPLDVVRVAKDGSWVVFCQARLDTNRDGEVWGSCRTLAAVRDGGGPRSDRRTMSLVMGAGTGVEIGTLAAVSDDERFLVVTHGSEALLVDTIEATATPLPFFDYDAVFTKDGRRLVHGAPGGLVVHEIGSSTSSLLSVDSSRLRITDIAADGDRVGLITEVNFVPMGSSAEGGTTVRWFSLSRRSFVGPPLRNTDAELFPGWGDYVDPTPDGEHLVFATDGRGRRLVATQDGGWAIGPLVWVDP